MAFWKSFFGDENEAALTRAKPIAAKVNALEPQFLRSPTRP